MDVDIRKLAVGVVGFSMALVGFFLSVTAPIVVAILPHLQAQAPNGVDLHERQRRRIQPRASLKSITPHVGPSDSASAASSNTSNTVSTVPLSPSLSTTSPPPALNPISPAKLLRELPSPPSTPHASLERACRSVAQHVCTAHACSNSASTSAHESASSPQPSPKMRVKSKSKDRGDSRSGSWLTASPRPPFYLQLSPRSSSESSRAPRSVSPTRSSTSDHDAPDAHRRPVMRRASTFLGLRRPHKTPVRADSEPSLRPATVLIPMPISVPETIAEGRRSEPSTPSPALHELSDEHLDNATISHGEKRRMSYFMKLKNKHKSKDAGKTKQLHDEAEHEPEGTEHGHERENRHRRRSLCTRDRRSAPAPTAPPRTRPYEAPYFFPAPASPEAVDYVQRTRNEYRQASVSPSFANRALHRDVPVVGPIPNSNAGPAGLGQGRQPSSILPQATLHSTPTHHVNFALTSTGKHRKSASASASGSPTADEFGLGLSPLAARSTSVSGH